MLVFLFEYFTTLVDVSVFTSLSSVWKPTSIVVLLNCVYLITIKLSLLFLFVGNRKG